MLERLQGRSRKIIGNVRAVVSISTPPGAVAKTRASLPMTPRHSGMAVTYATSPWRRHTAAGRGQNWRPLGETGSLEPTGRWSLPGSQIATAAFDATVSASSPPRGQ